MQSIHKQKIVNIDDIDFVTEFPCFLGRPVISIFLKETVEAVAIVQSNIKINNTTTNMLLLQSKSEELDSERQLDKVKCVNITPINKYLNILFTTFTTSITKLEIINNFLKKKLACTNYCTKTAKILNKNT